MNALIGLSSKTIDKIVFMWIMQITNLGWVQLFFSHLDINSWREPKSGSHNIQSVRFYYITSE